MFLKYNLKSVLILVLLIFLISLCLKCAIIEKFNNEINQTSQSINNINVDLLSQKENSSYSPSGFDGMTAYRKSLNHNPNSYNTNVTKSV